MVENINNPQSVRVVDTYNQTVAVYDAAKQKITGYENQVYASLEAIENAGWNRLTCRDTSYHAADEWASPGMGCGVSL